MREILFRAKSLKSGTWTQGYLFCCWEHAYIAWGMVNDNADMVEVYPETVCQYTGLTDKNGRKIFEGDILSFSAYGENYKGDVRFIKGNFTIWCGKCAPFLDGALEKHSAIVVGNIFDNPELIGEQP